MKKGFARLAPMAAKKSLGGARAAARPIQPVRGIAPMMGSGIPAQPASIPAAPLSPMIRR